MTWRRGLLAGLVALGLVAGAAAALPRVADELPGPLATLAHLPERVLTRWVRPRVTRRLTGLSAPEQEAVSRLGRMLDGLVVWSSNRSGNHELYVVDLRDRSMRQLTHTPNVEFLARFSPDGRRVLFLRSQREWVSAREMRAWDVWIIDVDGTQERRLARDGYHPAWFPDGKAILFQRGSVLIRLDLQSGQETVVVDGARELGGAEFGDAEPAGDGRVAFYLRGRFAGLHGLQGDISGAAVYDPASRKLTMLTREQACQTTWTPDGRSLLWMEPGGNGGTRIMGGAADGTGRHVFMDLPGARSHEYFPKLSNDGRWLTWGAAAEGHEHDRADYDIFVTRVGAPAAEAVRLTHHPGNDQWPDIYVRR